MSKEFPKSQEQKLQELKDIVNRVLTGPDLNKIDEIYERIGVFVKELEKEHPDLHHYALFHVLGVGTIPDYAKKFDLPGGEMEKYIRSLES